MSYSSDSISASICSMVGKLAASDSDSDSTSFVCHWEMPIGKPLGGQNKTSKKTQLPKASLGCWKGCVKLKSMNVKMGSFHIGALRVSPNALHWGFAVVPKCSPFYIETAFPLPTAVVRFHSRIQVDHLLRQMLTACPL